MLRSAVKRVSSFRKLPALEVLSVKSAAFKPINVKSFSQKHHDEEALGMPKEKVTYNDVLSYNEGLRKYMTKVYKTTAISVGGVLAAASVFSGIPVIALNPWVTMGLGFGGTLTGIIGHAYSQPITQNDDGSFNISFGKKFWYSTIMLGGACSLAPALLMVKGTGIALTAAGATTLTMGGAMAYTMAAPAGKLSSWQPALWGGLLGLVGLNVGAFLLSGYLSPGALALCHSVNVYGGIGLFAGLTAFDTHMAMKEYSEGYRDYYSHALNQYLNFINLFVRFIEVFRND